MFACIAWVCGFLDPNIKPQTFNDSCTLLANCWQQGHGNICYLAAISMNLERSASAEGNKDVTWMALRSHKLVSGIQIVD